MIRAGLPAAAALVLAAAAGPSAPAAAEERFPAREWIISTGYGHTIYLGPAHSREWFLLVAPEWSIRLGRLVDSVVEGHLVRFHGQVDTGTGGGLVPVELRLRGGPAYLTAGAGFLWTDLRVPELDRRFDYILQARAGWRLAARGARPLQVELRYIHYSNANTAGRNRGLNSVALLGAFGLR